MKLVKNCIKKCQFCGDYQSILSDVDKHQRVCPSNPNRGNALQFDDDFDEQKFLLQCAVAQPHDLVLDKSRSAAPVEERKHSSTRLHAGSRADSSNTVNVLNLKKDMYASDEDKNPCRPKSSQIAFDEQKQVPTKSG